MLVAQPIRSALTTNGNSRHGWIINDTEQSRAVGFVLDEGSGFRSLDQYPNIPTLAQVSVMPKEFNFWKKAFVKKNVTGVK